MEVERVSTVGSRRMTKVFATRLHVVERGVAGIWGPALIAYASEEPAGTTVSERSGVSPTPTPTRNRLTR
jgi:hypothetical protein